MCSRELLISIRMAYSMYLLVRIWSVLHRAWIKLIAVVYSLHSGQLLICVRSCVVMQRIVWPRILRHCTCSYIPCCMLAMCSRELLVSIRMVSSMYISVCIWPVFYSAWGNLVSNMLGLCSW